MPTPAGPLNASMFADKIAMRDDDTFRRRGRPRRELHERDVVGRHRRTPGPDAGASSASYGHDGRESRDRSRAACRRAAGVRPSSRRRARRTSARCRRSRRDTARRSPVAAGGYRDAGMTPAIDAPKSAVRNCSESPMMSATRSPRPRPSGVQRGRSASRGRVDVGIGPCGSPRRTRRRRSRRRCARPQPAHAGSVRTCGHQTGARPSTSAVT